MSYSKVAFATLFGIYSSCCLGMEPTPFQYSNPYFDQKLQKPLLLLMAKNQDPEAINLNKDEILVITAKHYDLYCNELFKSKIGEQSFEQFWNDKLSAFNDEKRIQTLYAQKIKYNDFMTMNEQGRKIFLNTIHVILNAQNSDIQTRSSTKTCRNFIKADKKNNQLNWVQDNTYNKMLLLPLQLRSKMGNVCPIVTGKEQFSYQYYFFTKPWFSEGLVSTYLGLLMVIPITGVMKMSGYDLTNLPISAIPLTCFSYGIGSSYIQKSITAIPTPTDIAAALWNIPEIKEDMNVVKKRIEREFTLTAKPLVPEKYAETLALQQEFQQSQKNILNIQLQTTHSLLTHE